jgi:hypothetical protein
VHWKRLKPKIRNVIRSYQARPAFPIHSPVTLYRKSARPTVSGCLLPHHQARPAFQGHPRLVVPELCSRSTRAHLASPVGRSATASTTRPVAHRHSCLCPRATFDVSPPLSARLRPAWHHARAVGRHCRRAAHLHHDNPLPSKLDPRAS